MKKKILTVLLLIVIIGSVFIFAACDKEKEEDDVSVSGDKPMPAYLYDCDYELSETEYDISDVTLTFIYGHRGEYSKRAFFLDRSLDNERSKGIELGTDLEYPPVPVYVYFSSFGNRYLYKKIDDFFSEEYLGKRKEVITIPQELFYNEYGQIWFFFTDKEDASYMGGDIRKTSTKSQCYIYYKKCGDKVQLSREDLAPPYKYQFIDGIGSGVTSMKGFYNKDITKQDYCAYSAQNYRKISETKDFEVNLYIGRIYGKEEKNIPSVDVYIISNVSGEEKKIFIRTIDDYMSDEYICTRTYYYSGKIREIIYNHSEKIYIPNEWIEGEEGEIEVALFDTKTQEKISNIIIGYKIRDFLENYGAEKDYDIY